MGNWNNFTIQIIYYEIWYPDSRNTLGFFVLIFFNLSTYCCARDKWWHSAVATRGGAGVFGTQECRASRERCRMYQSRLMLVRKLLATIGYLSAHLIVLVLTAGLDCIDYSSVSQLQYPPQQHTCLSQPQTNIPDLINQMAWWLVDKLNQMCLSRVTINMYTVGGTRGPGLGKPGVYCSEALSPKAL